MGEVKHTPGPWRATKKQDNVVVNEGGDKWIARALIGTKRSPRFMCDPEVAAANARLIAAAPDLLEALRAVDLARLSDTATDWQRATDLTDAAIAKAEGRS